MSDSIRANVSAFLNANGIAFAVSLIGETVREDNWTCDEWRYTLSRGNRIMRGEFFTGTGHRKQVLPMPSPAYRKGTLAYEQWAKSAFKPSAPHAADVLHSLILEAEAVDMSFTDWADNFGYDSDSIKARNTYDACCAIGKELRGILNREELETLRDLMQDY